MPEGASIFETTGAWEDFSTPSRDLRLLIAIDVVRGFPGPRRAAARTLRDAEGQERRRRLRPNWKARSRGACDTQVLLYAQRRLDWTLALKDVIDRAGDLEMAYNVNDCVELDGARRRKATRPRLASVAHLRHSGPRWRIIARGFTSGAALRANS